jgi:hypothetical protein
MAQLAGYLANISFEDYYVKKLGLTKDLNRVALYHKTFKEKGGITKQDIIELSRILKFDWTPYVDTIFKIKVARENEMRVVKIAGFLAYGKVFLQDVNHEPTYVIATPKEVIAVLEALEK